MNRGRNLIYQRKSSENICIDDAGEAFQQLVRAALRPLFHHLVHRYIIHRVFETVRLSDLG